MRQIINLHTRDVRGKLALDLAKALDTISHQFILEQVERIGLGPKFHAYVRAFLRDRKATIKIGESKSEAFTLDARGTPQGAVITPLLFNIAMKGLSERLYTMANTNHASYADDITVCAWVVRMLKWSRRSNLLCQSKNVFCRVQGSSYPPLNRSCFYIDQFDPEKGMSHALSGADYYSHTGWAVDSKSQLYSGARLS